MAGLLSYLPKVTVDRQKLDPYLNQMRGLLAEVTPGVGDYMAVQRGGQALSGAVDAAKQGNVKGLLGKGAEAATEYLSAIPGIGDIATMGKMAGGLLPAAMTAWHGSPHKFDRFDLRKIGTGEGAQAYGHGLYFAENPKVAGEYKDRLSTFDAYGSRRPSVATVDGVPARDLGQDVWEVADQIASGGHGDVDGLIAHIKSKLGETANPARAVVWRDLLEQSERVAGDLRGKAIKFDSGHLYEVDIPDDAIAKMLDWDAPLSEQPEAVREALERAGIVNFEKNIGPSAAGEIRDLGWSRNVGSLTGAQLYRRLVENKFSADLGATTAARKGSESAASTKLRELGIPGIRYLDGGSRSAGQGTRNFVVFDDQLPKILSRNGKGLLE